MPFRDCIATLRFVTDSYDEIPYDSSPITETDPDRLATLGRLFGLDPARPEQCRYLELGCAAGGNLIPLAWSYPQSRFVGVELSAVQAQVGQRLIERLELDNVEIRRADILELDVDSEAFDYIVAHGVWSWVPDPVRERILQLCARRLTPRGIAYISYNTLPGWRMRGMLRDMLLYHVGDAATPGDRLSRAQELLELMDTLTAGFEAASAQYLQQEIRAIRRADPSYLYHEYLAPVNEPCLFSDFVRRAAGHGLAYLCDADLEGMFALTLGDNAEETLARFHDPVQREQYIDFVRNRNFRQTLLCRSDVVTGDGPDLARFEAFSFFADLAPPKKVDLRRTKAQAFRRADGSVFEVSHPLTKAALSRLGAVYPQALSFDELLSGAHVAVSQAGDQRLAAQSEHLFGELFSLFVHQVVGATLQTGRPQPSGALPRASRLAAAQLEFAQDQVATSRHTTLRLEPLAQRLLCHLDGSRDLEALAAALEQDVVAGRLASPRRGERPLEGAALQTRLRTEVERLVTLFARQGILEDS